MASEADVPQPPLDELMEREAQLAQQRALQAKQVSNDATVFTAGRRGNCYSSSMATHRCWQLAQQRVRQAKQARGQIGGAVLAAGTSARSAGKAADQVPVGQWLKLVQRHALQVEPMRIR